MSSTVYGTLDNTQVPTAAEKTLLDNITNETIAAAGSNQDTATALSGKSVVLITSGSGGVRLPAPVLGIAITIINDCGNILSLYPASGHTIRGLAVNIPAGMYYRNVMLAIPTSTTEWVVTNTLPVGMDGNQGTPHLYSSLVTDVNPLATAAGINNYSNFNNFGGNIGLYAGDILLALGTVQAIKMTDNLAEAFYIGEATNRYASFITTDGSELVKVHKPLDLTTSTAGQIAFPGSQNASSGVNTLDDYEEGTWTPSFGLTSGSVTYSAQTGTYVKIGQKVTFSGRITLSAVSTPVNVATTLAGLPFTQASKPFGLNVQYASGITLVGQLVGYTTGGGGTTFTLAAQNSGNMTNLSALTALSNTTDIIFTGTYQASA